MARRSVNRDLTLEEKELLRWLLAHGVAGAEAHLAEVDSLRVVAGCDCGCASIDFVSSTAGLQVLSEHKWQDEHGHLFGVFAFAKDGKLAGVEVWSIDGEATPTSLPAVESLAPL